MDAMTNGFPNASQNETEPNDTLSRATFLVLAVALLGVALQISSGFYDAKARAESDIALLLIVVAFAFCTLATLRPTWIRGAVSSSRIFQAILYIALAGQFLFLWRNEILPNVPLQNNPDYWIYRRGIIVAALCVFAPTSQAQASTRLAIRLWGNVRLPLLLTCFFALGIWTIVHLKTIEGDVLTVQRDSATALMKGTNPYGITFPDVYNHNMTYYKPEHIANGRLLFGYVYPPLSLLLVLPGLIFGDIRFALLAFWTLAGAFIGFTKTGKHSVLFVALLLFTPRIFFANVVGWTEAMLCMSLALTVFFASRQQEKPESKTLSFALGALLALKQYTFFLLPLSFLLTPSKIEYSKLLRRALGVVAVVSLPMILWNPAAFFHSAIRLNFTLPFRLDALNVTVWIARNTGFVVPTFVGFGLAALAVFVALKRCPRSPFGFASATAWVYFVFFLFGRQGFANYYLFVMCAMCCALATLDFE